jgi:hypothetical protein
MEIENQIINRKKSLFAWLSFSALLLTTQGYLLWMDHHPMFFLGDSASYIWTAISGNPPTDRSFIYGYFIRLIAVSTQSLMSIVIAQVFLLCAASLVTAHLLIRYFHVRLWIAFIIALLATIEPLQMLYARYVMTESLALTVFVFYVWTALHYLEYPKIIWFIVMQCLATLMISIRFAFIPMVWICAFAIPLLAAPTIIGGFRVKEAKPILRVAIHLAVSVLFLFVFTTAYKHYHGYLQHKPPAYSYDSGFFSLAFVMPIVEPDDFIDKDFGRRVLRDLKFSVNDRQARAAQLWVEGGVINRLQRMEPDRMKADAIARQAAIRAIARKPLAFLKLGSQTFTDYLNPSYLRSSMEYDLGNVRLDDGFHDLIKKQFRYLGDQSSAFDLKAPTGRYFLFSGHWLQFLLFMPLWWCLLILPAQDIEQRQKSLLMGLISFIFIGVVIFLVVEVTPRYLHLPAWLFFLASGVGLNRILDMLNR